VARFEAKSRHIGCATVSEFAKAAARSSGHALAFTLAAFLIVAWLAAGPFFGWDDSWQLTINTATTIVTFLMVFIIQNTQARDAEAMQIKLDALLESHRGKEPLMGLEEWAEEDLHKLQKMYEAKAERSRKNAGNEAKTGTAKARTAKTGTAETGTAKSRKAKARQGGARLGGGQSSGGGQGPGRAQGSRGPQAERTKVK
jgi:low affinity Fe/Cu permease